MSDHALYSASSSHRWLNCISAIALEQGLPDSSSYDAEEGTVFHDIMAQCFTSASEPYDFLDQTYQLIGGKIVKDAISVSKEGTFIKVGQDMVEYAQHSCQIVDDFTPKGAKRFIETRVVYGDYIGIPEQFGTLDVGVLHKDEICALDHKYGKGIPVEAKENTQLMLYALGFLARYGKFLDFKKVRLVVNQPRKENLSEWTCSVDDLLDFAKYAKKKALEAEAVRKKYNMGVIPENKMEYAPEKKTCQWCKKRKTATGCYGLEAQALALIADDFVDLTKEDQTLGKLRNAVDILPKASLQRLSTLGKGTPLVELWIKGVREAMFRHLAQGDLIKDFKLVRGKAGNKKWIDDGQAIAAMVAFGAREKNLYKQELMSPTQIKNTVFKARPNQWKELEAAHVTQGLGKLSVAPANDEREAVSVTDISDDFEDLTEGEE